MIIISIENHGYALQEISTGEVLFWEMTYEQANNILNGLSFGENNV